MFNKNKNCSYSETEFSCKRDGLTIRGTEYRPLSPKSEKLPIAIVSHGFMAFQDTVRHYAKAFAEMGYLSYCFDFSGGCVSCGPMKLGRRYVEDVIRMDPFAEISGFSGKVLIVHGSGDKVVDISYSQKAYEAYREKRTEDDGTVALRIIENAGHGFSKKEDETALEYLKSFAE